MKINFGGTKIDSREAQWQTSLWDHNLHKEKVDRPWAVICHNRTHTHIHPNRVDKPMYGVSESFYTQIEAEKRLLEILIEITGAKKMKPADHIIDVDCAYDAGWARSRAQLLHEAEEWCKRLHESAAFSPEQRVTQGQMMSANDLLEYLKK